MAQNNLHGILFMLAGMSIFAIVDAMAKYLTQDYHPMQIVWTRQLGFFVGAVILIAWRGTVILQTKRRGLQILRGLFAVMSAWIFITGIAIVPLADATSVTFVAPLIVVVIGALVLREPVGWHRWSAVIIGFMGTLIILRPGFDAFNPALLFPFFAACFFAGRQIISRYLAQTETMITTICYTAIVSFIATCIPLYAVWQMPNVPSHIWLMLAMTLLSAIGEICIIWALQIGLAVAVAPMHYTILLWSTLYGYLFFNQLPDGFTVGGGLMIIATGLYALYREHVKRTMPS
ncbi:MAG: DMT family transporter [Candidatus Puniceispirillaceae bacterium]